MPTFSGNGNLERFLLLYSKSCFPESEVLKGFIFNILVFVFRYRKCEKILRNRLFGYSTAYNKSEGAILSWIAGTDTGVQTPGGWGAAVSGHGNLKRLLFIYPTLYFPTRKILKVMILCFKSCFPEPEM